MELVGHWVFQRALADFHKIDANDGLFLSVNLSVDEVSSPAFADAMFALIDASSVSPDRLVVELTETSIMQRPKLALRHCEQLIARGVHVVINGFGAGYASLSYLKKLPISILKIDKSFIDEIEQDAHDAIIVKSTIALAHGLGLQVIAEGVESSAQYAMLQAEGCNDIQGHYFAKPSFPEAMQPYLAENLA